MDGNSVLVVEDTPDTRELLKIMLEMQGYRVLEADNGRDAISVAVSEHPDAILMDMSLPIMDGCQATKHIRQRPELKNVPIIACTAHNRWEWHAKAIVAGCNDFVEKPIDFNRLRELLSQHIRRPNH